MLVIGIDPGTAITGYGVVRDNEEGGLVAVDYGVIETPARLPMPERLLQLHKGLAEIISLHRPENGAVEKLFFQKNVRTAISVGQARGVALLALAEQGISISEYTPMEVKQAVTGYGGADKNQVQQMVKALLNLEELPRPDDAADALAVAICHLHSAQMQSIYGA
ncbi:MAG: crossover junction endodeoxyribonuclease RuvC [Anaerolineales bacterium]|nr:crossover junction endodeoxyribonuclease RuvC [Anaerolineales bacterium]MCK5315505.1 crossover junction endodeoxyribonuclease RuvC [Anaerolineales bacterium]